MAALCNCVMLSMRGTHPVQADISDDVALTTGNLMTSPNACRAFWRYNCDVLRYQSIRRGGGTARHGTARGGLRCMFLETQSPDSAWDDFHVNLIICLFKSNLTNVLDGANTDRTL